MVQTAPYAPSFTSESWPCYMPFCVALRRFASLAGGAERSCCITSRPEVQGMSDSHSICISERQPRGSHVGDGPGQDGRKKCSAIGFA